MDKKSAALALLTLTVLAAVIGGLIMTTQATDTNSTTTDTTTTTTDTTTAITTDQDSFHMEGMDRGGHGGRGGPGGCMGGMGTIEVSSEYTASVNAILEADTDVQNLLDEGYNVTSIRPIIKSVVEADGTVTTKATTAIAFLENGTSGYATVGVDVENAAVMKIVIITRTVIDKTSS